MFHTDTLRLIKKTFNRFFSLFMIVLIGVAFMMGLFSTRQIMEDSVDVYADQMNLQDIQIYSSYGFREKDVDALASQEFAERVFASKMIDVYSRSNDNLIAVTRVEEINRNVNEFELLEGRLPFNDTECVVMNNSLNPDAYKIGETIEVYLEDEDVLDSLHSDHFTIVGIAKTPAYLAKTLGTSNLKNLELDLVIYTHNLAFKSEYYTTVYLTLKDAKDKNSFRREYTDFTEEKIADVEAFAAHQQDDFKEYLTEQYTEEIQRGEEELAERKAEAEAQFAEAKQKLDDAQIQILASQSNIDSLTTIIESGEKRIQALRTQYQNQAAATDQKIREIEASDPAHRSFEAIMAELTTDYATYNALKTMQSQSSAASYTDIENETNTLRAELSALQAERASIEASLADPNVSEEERAALSERYSAVLSEITQKEVQIAANERLIEQLKEYDEANKGDIERTIQTLENKYGGNIAAAFQNYSRLAQDKLLADSLSEEIRLAEEAVARARQEISSAQAQINAGKREYEKGLKEYQENLLLFQEEMEKADAQIRKAYQDLEELPEAKWMVLDRDSHYSSYMFAQNAKQMGAIGISLPFLFYLVAALVCMTTMTRLIDEQRGQIGIFRALGFSKAQITAKYLIYALAATLSGSVLGIIFGMAIFPTVIYNTWRLMYDLPPMQIIIPPQNIVICILAFSLLMMAVTYLVLKKTLKESPSQLLRPKAPKNARKVFLEYIPLLWNRLSFTGKITARNLIRYKTRFFMTVIGVAGCTGLLVVGWGIKDSISDVVALQFGELFNHNYVVNLSNDHALNEMTEELDRDLSHEFVTPYLSYASKIYLPSEEKVIQVYVMDAREGNDVFHLRKTDHKTELKINNSGVLVSEKFARNNKIKKGDTITIESLNGIKKEVKVSDITEMYFQHYLFMSNDLYETVFDEPIHPNALAVKSTDKDALIDEISEMEGYESVVDFDSVTEQFNIMIRALNFIILVIILTAGSLAFVVLINLTQVNISERIREIATLKVLGFRTYEVNSYIFKEIFLLTVIGALLGLPLGIVEHHFIMNVINMEMIMFGMNVKPLTFVYAFTLTIVFTVIVLFMTRKTLRNIEMIESLKSVE